VPSQFSPFYFTYGTIFHKCAEEFVRHEGKKSLGIISKEILEGKIPIEEHNGIIKYAPKLPAEYKEKFPNHLKALQKLTDQIGFEGKNEIEWSFEYDLEPPNNKCVVGFIDRLIIKNDKYFIIDYKTSKNNGWRKTPKTIINDLQLQVYARVVQKTFNVDAKAVQAALYYVDGGNLVGARFTNETLLRAEQELLRAYCDIISTEPNKAYANVGEHCRRCEFNSLCPHYKKK
jgi:hypothetical protein